MIKLEIDEDRLREWKADLAKSKRKSAEKRTRDQVKGAENRLNDENRAGSDLNDALIALFDDENRDQCELVT